MRRQQLVTAVIGMTLVAAACGTRLDDSDFVAAAQGEGIEAVGGEDFSDFGSGVDLVDPDTGETVTGGGTSSGGRTTSGGSGGSSSGGNTGGSGGGGGGGGPAAPNTCGGTNTASDTGVTPTQITLGNIRAVTGALGPDAFAGPYQGARAFFLDLNARGGVCGRKIKFLSCDDKENADKDKECVRKLVDESKIFAFTANATRSYAGAPLVNEKGVPDVGSIPIANAYQKFPMLFSLYGGAGYPRDGSQLGVNGKQYILSGAYKWFREKQGITKAAVIFYDEPISRTAGNFIADGLEREGIEVVYMPNNGQGRNIADPAWDSEVIRMREAGAQALWQAIDIAGFQKLCEAMDRLSFTVKAAVTTIAGWSQTVGSNFSSPCRSSIWSTGSAVPYSRTDHPEIKKFRAAMDKYDPKFPMRQWAVDGWTAAALITEGIQSMGPNPTRKGLVDWLNKQDGTNQGPNNVVERLNWDWRNKPSEFSTSRDDCFSVAKWDEAKGAFTDQSGADSGFVCIPGATYYSYEPVPDGTT